MNSKFQRNSPSNMFGASSSSNAARKYGGGYAVASATYYRKPTAVGPTEQQQQRTRRKTEPSSGTEPMSIPTSRHGSPFGGSSRSGSPREGSPFGGIFYAGAKFSEPPSPASLPNPPSHWVKPTGECRREFSQEDATDQYREISNQLKLLLNIRA